LASSKLRAAKAKGALSVLLATDDEAHKGQVRDILLALDEPQVEVADAALAQAVAAAAEADVVIAAFGVNEDASLEYLQQQSERRPRPSLFALLPAESDALMRRALRAGADEVLFAPLQKNDLIRALLKVSETRRRTERIGAARISSVTSIVGGVGVSTITANLGLALMRLGGARVALMDLDLQQGGLGILLDANFERTILPLAGHRKLDSISLEAAMVKHASGLYLLAAPKRIEDSETITEQTVGAVLELMRQLFDYVIIDCGHRVDEVSVAAWERSQDVLYVLDQSVAAGRCAWRFMDVFGRLQIEIEPRLVLNKYEPKHSITEGQITSTLQYPICAHIPRDDLLMERVAAMAQTPWQIAPRSALVRAFEGLARNLASANGNGAGAESSSTAGIVTRVLGLLSARA
jgi:pilus assembly protein CpaE